MKLDEIIDTTFRAVRASREMQPKRNLTKELAHGYFGAVLSTKDPHMVAKISSGYPTMLERDGYFRYISWVVSHHLAEENTYFPRVYDMTVIDTQQDTGRGHYNIKLEKLLTVWECEPEELIALVKRIVNLEIYGETSTGESLDVEMYGPGGIREHVEGYISDAVRGYVRYNETKRIKDFMLKDAITQILAMISESGLKEDFYKRNWMFRRTSVGLQLVFTDPVS